MNSSDSNFDDGSEADSGLRGGLRSLPTPETPANLESRVHLRIRQRRIVRSVRAGGSVLALAGGLLIWQAVRPRVVPDPPAPEVVQNPVVPPREIPLDDLAVLFAPPPVDSLNIVSNRNEKWVAALNRLEGTK